MTRSRQSSRLAQGRPGALNRHTVLDMQNLKRIGYDVHGVDLYRQNARDLYARSTGIERYVIGIFGPDLIGSWAMALDLNKQFYNSVNKTATLVDGPKVVRTRKILGIRSEPRTEHWVSANIQKSYRRNPYGGLFEYYYTGPERSETSGNRDRGNQPPCYGLIRDTTRSSRPIEQTQGEFELFVPKMLSKSRHVAWQSRDQVTSNSIGNGQRNSNETFKRSVVSGPELRVLDADVQVYLTNVRARAVAALQKNVYGMLERIQPSHKTYDLFYQIAELKDLKQTLQGSLQVWLEFERLVGTRVFQSLLRAASNWRNPTIVRHYLSTVGRNYGPQFETLVTIDEIASKAFLTFKFGWESMVRAVQDFLPSPKKVSEEINYLVQRIGKDTSFRTKRKWVDSETYIPTFTCQLYKDEDIHDSTVRKSGVRHIEIRCMANFHIKFPQLDIPRLRSELLRRKMGAYPTPSSLYNLVPWTWLADWFTGCGDYVALLDTMSNDKSTINYGFITYREDMEVTASIAGKLTTSHLRNLNGVSSSYDTFVVIKHEGKFIMSYQLRMSIPRVSTIKSYWDNSLNANQLAIVGALLGTRTGYKTRRLVS